MSPPTKRRRMSNGEVSNGTDISPNKWRYLNNILTRPGPFTDPEAPPLEAVTNALETTKVLVIGAGGLGCEILKNLALTGFKDIHVIDMDTIDVSNLNRQFLFRQSDVGQPKAECAARFVEKRVKGVKITPIVGNIKDHDEEYYSQFGMVICGLDNIDARRWINSMLVGMVDPENPDTMKPLIDGGTEGFKGQARVVVPTMTSCIECQLDMHAPARPTVPLCTLATIPRQPEHCIEWAHIIAWDEQRKGDSLDTDDPEHIMWLYRKASERAEKFNIQGVTYSKTQGVVKNIIPAIASTNAIIAASCCNEAFKLLTSTNPALGLGENNYMMYTGDESVYTFTFPHMQKEDCPICGNTARDMDVKPNMTLQEFIDGLAERPEAQLKKPTVASEAKSLYYQAPPALEESTRPNLSKKMSELVTDGEELAISDPAFAGVTFRFKTVFK